jgi:hypothetical protein
MPAALDITANIYFSVAAPESSVNYLLHHSEEKEHVIRCITTYIFSLH